MLRGIQSTFLAIGASMVISGCAAPSGSAPPLMLREMARSYLIGTTYDQALNAAQQDDQSTLHDRLNRLDALNASNISADLQLTHAEQLVRDAESLDIQAEQIKNTFPAKSRQLQGIAGQKYRMALRWSPDFPSDDPLLLNALGYYLADHGYSTADFALGAELTNRGIALLQKAISDNTSTGTSNERMLQQIKQQQALTRDSYAWALYKLKRYEEAETVQDAALAQAKSSGLKDREAVAELQSHLAKILQARDKKANDAMKELQQIQSAK